MNISEAGRLARALMNEHDLRTWIFQFDRSKKRFGLCDHNRKTISLSEHLVRLNDESHVRNTILHEIAHALVGPEVGHGPQWKRTARSIGCTGDRCYSAAVVATPEREWVGTCPNCGHQIKRHRRGTLACRACCIAHNGGKFTERFLIRWAPNRLTARAS